MHTTRQRGYTLIEVIIVIALVGIIVSFGVAMSIGSISRSSVLQERDLFVTLLLRGARAQALANVNQASHGVYIDNGCHRYILFEGNSFTPPGNCDPDPRDIYFTNDAISISSTGGNTIIFRQLSGDVTPGAGTITLKSNSAEQKIIINEAGQINW